MLEQHKKKKTIILTAGGTGGHMFPAEALGRDLISRGYNVEFVTDTRGEVYKDSLKDMKLHTIRASSLKGGIFGKVASAFSMAIGYFQAKNIVDKSEPSVVVGFGGYPSVPSVLAAQRKNIPTIIHEQNAILGKANAFLAPKADRIALSLPYVQGLDEVDAVRAVVTGNPVRPEFSELYSKPYPAIDTDSKIRIFVMGGSLGATVFSDVVPFALKKLDVVYRKNIEIVQQCREEDLERTKAAYQEAGIQAELKTFFTDVSDQLQKCHLVIARSGAGTVAEVTTAGRPAIFVPYPWHADQQQKINAESVAEAGGAWVMLQSGFTEEALAARIETFMHNPETLFRAAEASRTCGRPDASRKLGNLVMAISNGWDKEKSKPFDLTQGLRHDS